VPEFSLFKWALLEVFAGSRLEYGMLVNNAGGTARHVIVSDTLPVGTEFGGCDCTVAGLLGYSELDVRQNGFCGAPYICGTEDGTIVWRVDEMEAGRSLEMTFWVTVDGELPDGALVVNDTYAVAADYVTPVVGSPPVTTTVRQLLLSITKSAWPNPVTVGNELLFTIMLQNDGSWLQDLIVTDLLPSEVSFVDCGGALCEFSDGQQPEVRWWVSALDTGTAQELTMRVLPFVAVDDRLVNESYGVWVRPADQRVMGAPVEVGLITPYDQLAYLPLILRDY
jgi:uncharacterized repeat protein (TIGR01451 family)